MSLMRYNNIEIVDFTEKIANGGVTHSLYEDMSQRNFESIRYTWVHYYTTNENNHSKCSMRLRNLAPQRNTIFQNNCVTVIASKELRKKINSWL